MILRLSAKLAAKLKVSPRDVLPADGDPLADWSGHLFVAGRTQYLLLTNTATLYSSIINGRGVRDAGEFLQHAMSGLRDVMERDGLAATYDRCVAPAAQTVRFSKALSRSVTRSMNELVLFARLYLAEREMSPGDASAELNGIILSAIGNRVPREVMRGLSREQPRPGANET
jgi:hypothetical protein